MSGMDATGEQHERKGSKLGKSFKSATLPAGAVLMDQPGGGFFSKFRRSLRLSKKSTFNFKHSADVPEKSGGKRSFFRSKHVHKEAVADSCELKKETSRTHQNANPDKENVFVSRPEGSNGINASSKSAFTDESNTAKSKKTSDKVVGICSENEDKNIEEFVENFGVDPGYESLESIRRKLGQEIKDKTNPSTSGDVVSRQNKEDETLLLQTQTETARKLTEQDRDSGNNPVSGQMTQEQAVSNSVDSNLDTAVEEDLYANAKVFLRKQSQKLSQAGSSTSEQQSVGLGNTLPISVYRSSLPDRLLTVMDTESPDRISPPPLPARNYSEKDVFTRGDKINLPNDTKSCSATNQVLINTEQKCSIENTQTDMNKVLTCDKLNASGSSDIFQDSQGANSKVDTMNLFIEQGPVVMWDSSQDNTEGNKSNNDLSHGHINLPGLHCVEGSLESENNVCKNFNVKTDLEPQIHTEDGDRLHVNKHPEAKEEFHPERIEIDHSEWNLTGTGPHFCVCRDISSSNSQSNLHTEIPPEKCCQMQVQKFITEAVNGIQTQVTKDKMINIASIAKRHREWRRQKSMHDVPEPECKENNGAMKVENSKSDMKNRSVSASRPKSVHGIPKYVFGENNAVEESHDFYQIKARKKKKSVSDDSSPPPPSEACLSVPMSAGAVNDVKDDRYCATDSARKSSGVSTVSSLPLVRQRSEESPPLPARHMNVSGTTERKSVLEEVLRRHSKKSDKAVGSNSNRRHTIAEAAGKALAIFTRSSSTPDERVLQVPVVRQMSDEPPPLPARHHRSIVQSKSLSEEVALPCAKKNDMGVGSKNNQRHSTTSACTASQARHDFLKSMKQLKECGWYWGPLSTDEAVDKLMDRRDGSFLVRDSSSDRYLLSISFKFEGKIHHTRIEYHKGLFSFWEQPDENSKAHICEFIKQTVEQSKKGKCISFQSTATPGAAPLNIPLLYPVSRFFRVQSLQHMCRFQILRLVRRDLIEQLPLPSKVQRYLLEEQYYVETLEED